MKTPRRERGETASAPGYRIVFRAAELSAIPRAWRAIVGVSIGGHGDATLADLRVPLADAVATGILVYPRPPSTLDRRIADSLAPGSTGANRLPPHMAAVTMVVATGGHEIAALPPSAVGSQIPITVTLFPPNGTPIDVPEWTQSGATAAITVVPFAPGRGFLPARWHAADAHPEGAAGLARAFAGTGAQLFADLLDETGRLATRAGSARAVAESVAIVGGAWHAPQGLARAPLFTDAAGMTVDVGRLDELLLARRGARPVEFEVAAGAALSAWEARALDIATGAPSVSTGIAAKAGAAAGGAPRVLRGRARAAALGALSPAGRLEVNDALAQGLVVILPRAPQALGRWIGESYVLLDPRSGRGAWLLRGTLHGAVTTDAAAALLVAVRDGGDPSATLAAWRKNRAGRALLAREGWPSGLVASKVSGVAPLLAPAAARESVRVPGTRAWPPVGGTSVRVEIGTPIDVPGVGPALWMGSGTRLLDPEVARAFAGVKGLDPKTRLFTGPIALAVVPAEHGEGRLLPVPARY